MVHNTGLLLHCRDGRLAGPEEHPAVWVPREEERHGFFFMTLFMLILAADYPNISKNKGGRAGRFDSF